MDASTNQHVTPQMLIERIPFLTDDDRKILNDKEIAFFSAQYIQHLQDVLDGTRTMTIGENKFRPCEMKDFELFIKTEMELIRRHRKFQNESRKRKNQFPEQILILPKKPCYDIRPIHSYRKIAPVHILKARILARDPNRLNSARATFQTVLEKNAKE